MLCEDTRQTRSGSGPDTPRKTHVTPFFPRHTRDSFFFGLLGIGPYFCFLDRPRPGSRNVVRLLEAHVRDVLACECRKPQADRHAGSSLSLSLFLFLSFSLSHARAVSRRSRRLVSSARWTPGEFALELFDEGRDPGRVEREARHAPDVPVIGSDLLVLVGPRAHPRFRRLVSGRDERVEKMQLEVVQRAEHLPLGARRRLLRRRVHLTGRHRRHHVHAEHLRNEGQGQGERVRARRRTSKRTRRVHTRRTRRQGLERTRFLVDGSLERSKTSLGRGVPRACARIHTKLNEEEDKNTARVPRASCKNSPSWKGSVEKYVRLYTETKCLKSFRDLKKQKQHAI